MKKNHLIAAFALLPVAVACSVPLDSQDPTEAEETTASTSEEVTACSNPLGATYVDLVVADVSYDALGCSISQASTSVLTDLAIGRPLTEVMSTLAEFTAMVTSRGKIDGDEDVLGDGIAFAGVSKYPARVKCALLGWMAFKDAAAQSLDNSQPLAQQPALQQHEGADT